MGIIKLKQIKQLTVNLQELITIIVEEDHSDITIYDVYIESAALLQDNNLLDDTLKSLYDYLTLVIVDDIKDNIDITKKLKKLYKNLNISDENYLLHLKQVVNVVHRAYEMDNETDGLENRLVAQRVIVAIYYFILIYMFDLCNQNKKITIGNKQITYGNLFELENLITNNTLAEKSAVATSIAAIQHIPYDIVLKNLNQVNYATSIKYKTQFELPLINMLLHNLLSRDEFSNYCKSLTVGIAVSNALVQEFKEEEDTVELVPKLYELLRHRAYLIPHCGISLVPSSMEVSMDVYERQYNGDNYLIIFVKLNKATEFTGHLLINLNKQFMLSTFPYVYDIISFLYNFYKLEEKALDKFGIEYSSDPKLYYSYNIIQFIDPKKVIKGKSATYKDFTIEVPYYWRYKDTAKKYKVLNKEQFLDAIRKGNKEVYISAFKRKLPSGFKPSNESIEMAKVYCLDLEPGETLVSPHIREY